MTNLPRAETAGESSPIEKQKDPAHSSEARIPELDGLRGLAILLVIICHYIANAEHAQLGFWPSHFFSALSVGWSGVDLFFVLSGFLIGGILLDSRDSPRYFRTFYSRRVHRILPIYYAWILLYISVIGVLSLLDPANPLLTGRDLAAVPIYFIFLQNMYFALTSLQWKFLSVTWSLAVEEQFYLLAPPLIRWLPPRQLMTVLVTVILATPIVRYFVLHYLPDGHYAAVFAMPCRADALAFGILASIAWRRRSFREFLDGQPRVLSSAFIVGLCGFAGLLWWLARPVSTVTVTIGYTWLAAFYTCLLLMVLSQPQNVIARLIRARWLRYLGGISYGVYLIHLTVDQLVHLILLHGPPRIYDFKGVGVTLLAGLITWAVAGLSWKYFEKPLICRGHRYVY